MTEQPLPPPLLRLTPEQRHANLEARCQQLFAHGWRVQQMSDTTATLTSGQPVNHVLHLLLTLVTCGLWVIVWALMAASGGVKTLQVHVDEWGRVTP